MNTHWHLSEVSYKWIPIDIYHKWVTNEYPLTFITSELQMNTHWHLSQVSYKLIPIDFWKTVLDEEIVYK
jgi:hypothetical protein